MNNQNNVHHYNVHHYAQILWDYNNLAQPPHSADVLIVMGHNDLGVPEHAASLCKAFDYPVIIVTGGVPHINALHGQPFDGLEADIMADILVKAGIDKSKIHFERNAKNTGDNITCSRMLAGSLNLEIKTGQLVHVPSMQRRALATAEQQWPGVAWSVSAQQTSLDDYIKGLNAEKFIHDMVGDTYRILDYPRLGFQTLQDMPSDVRNAMDELIKLGYRRRIPDTYMGAA